MESANSKPTQIFALLFHPFIGQFYQKRLEDFFLEMDTKYTFIPILINILTVITSNLLVLCPMLRWEWLRSCIFTLKPSALFPAAMLWVQFLPCQCGNNGSNKLSRYFVSTHTRPQIILVGVLVTSSSWILQI